MRQHPLGVITEDFAVDLTTAGEQQVPQLFGGLHLSLTLAFQFGDRMVGTLQVLALTGILGGLPCPMLNSK